MSSSGRLIVISGPSGCGKDSVVKELVRLDSRYIISVSLTSRAKRAGEKEGRDYFFVEKEQFQHKIDNGEMLEYTEYVGNLYGTEKAFVRRSIQNGKSVILIIEVEGAMQVRRLFNDAVLVFIKAPSYEELRERLVARGTDDEKSIELRLARAAQELEYSVDYDYEVINDDVDSCAEEILQLLQKHPK